MIQSTSIIRNLQRQWLLALILLVCVTMPAFSGGLNLVYEQVVKDSFGNEIGYRTTKLTSIESLPVGSAWRNYLNLKLPDGKSIYEYARDTSQYLAKPMTLTLSDRNNNAFTAKSASSYDLNLYTYINNFSSDSSKTFLFLHEFGHVAMLNAYPSNYDFSGLNYGTDGRHYLDEVLPNDNTAWVEGWGNAFAASKNNGMVFSFNLNDISSIAFLKSNTFGEMARNELFVAKVLYDSFNKISSGKDKTFNAMSRTGPHSSLRDFCAKYVALYPDNKAALAKILVENSQGKISLNELLTYVNGGSRTVSRDLYTYLAQAGLVAATTGSTTQPATQTQTQTATTPNTTTTTSSTSTSFWGRLSSWFGKLFNSGAQTPVAASPTASVEFPSAPSVSGTVPSNGATAPELPGTSTIKNELASVNDLGKAEELYYQYFAEYNRLMAGSNSSKQLIVEAQTKMLQAKARVKELRHSLK